MAAERLISGSDMRMLAAEGSPENFVETQKGLYVMNALPAGEKLEEKENQKK